MKRKNRRILLFLFIAVQTILTEIIYSHGFAAHTVITRSSRKKKYIPIERLSEDMPDETQYITGFDLRKNACVKQKVTSAAYVHTNCCIVMHIDEWDIISCAPTQEFYSFDYHCWIPGHQLTVGDRLFGKDKTPKYITSIKLIQEPFKLYAIQVKQTHNYFVGHSAILTHNMPLPLLTAGVGFSFCTGAASGGMLGITFGPISITAGALFGGCIGMMIKALVGPTRLPHYEFEHKLSWEKGLLTKNDEDEKSDEENKENRRTEGSITGGACGGGSGKPPWDPRDPWKRKVRWHFENSSIDSEKLKKSVDYSTTERKLEHFFENNEHDHGFTELLEKLGGIKNSEVQKKLVEEVIKDLIDSGKLPFEGKFKDIPVDIFGETIITRGRIMEGIIKLGTIFIRSKKI